MKKGFTLLELIIVIIIIGILATIGYTQYSGMVEKGREAEARSILGAIRTSMEAYYVEHEMYESDPDVVGVTLPVCDVNHWYQYFIWSVNNAATPYSYALCAARCISGSGGRKPDISDSNFYYICFKSEQGGNFERYTSAPAGYCSKCTVGP